ncbi:amidohydrolase family protein [Rubinisphaera margarita]|uniref:amidohydrolase family protein n=1 Tax=Rubinisphaera margarita TaxID=2909586 RepID=UPI001EE87CAC|nr:amidohydrolase family protein [Rubinisphaera margarita]MCG6155592.1 amidohydrolase family protein [Rubinisphaera margarita]
MHKSTGHESLLSRRDMLKASTAAAAVTMTGTSLFGKSDSNTSGFIDAHVHVWTPDTSTYPLKTGYSKEDMQPPSFTPKELMAHAGPSGVDCIVLIQMSFYGYDNSYMLHVMDAHPGRYSGVAVIDPEDKPVATMKALKKKGVRGFRIVAGKQDPDQWLKSKGMRAMWRCAADEDMAMCPLMNPEYIPSVAAMCRKFPETTVVVDHFARIGISGTVNEADLDALCQLADHEKTYVKTSAFYALGKKSPPYTDLGPMIRRCRDAFGADRLMWASDCPYQVQENHTYAASIDLIREKLDFLSDEDRESMLRGTAEKVFFS